MSAMDQGRLEMYVRAGADCRQGATSSAVRLVVPMFDRT